MAPPSGHTSFHGNHGNRGNNWNEVITPLSSASILTSVVMNCYSWKSTQTWSKLGIFHILLTGCRLLSMNWMCVMFLESFSCMLGVDDYMDFKRPLWKPWKWLVRVVIWRSSVPVFMTCRWRQKLFCFQLQLLWGLLKQQRVSMRPKVLEPHCSPKHNPGVGGVNGSKRTGLVLDLKEFLVNCALG